MSKDRNNIYVLNVVTARMLFWELLCANENIIDHYQCWTMLKQFPCLAAANPIADTWAELLD